MSARRALNNLKRTRRLVGGFGAVSPCGMRFLLSLLLASSLTATLRADRAEELARFHIEAIGGSQRIAALSALRATGQAFAAGRQVRFTMTAARPARLLLETENGGRTLKQGTDGVEPPWEIDTGTQPPTNHLMADNTARTFQADAEFDDPLVAGESRGYSMEFAGEMEVGGRKLLRILVTRKLADTFSVMLDDETLFIVMKVEQRTSLSGRKNQVVTHFEDYRPVEGVLLPHRITVAVEGQASQQTRIARIEANPKLEPNLFKRPKPPEPVAAPPEPKP